jgi:hypothetical protein
MGIWEYVYFSCEPVIQNGKIINGGAIQAESWDFAAELSNFAAELLTHSNESSMSYPTWIF